MRLAGATRSDHDRPILVVLTLPTAALVRGAAATRLDPADANSAQAIEGSGPDRSYTSLREAFRTREVLQMVGMFALAMSAFSALQVYHVPAMQAAGVSLSTATTVAGVRGFLSLPGRALLSPIASRPGAPGAAGDVLRDGCGCRNSRAGRQHGLDLGLRGDHGPGVRDDRALARASRDGGVRRAADRDVDGHAVGDRRRGFGGGSARDRRASREATAMAWRSA